MTFRNSDPTGYPRTYTPSQELTAMKEMSYHLDQLNQVTRDRVLRWMNEAYGYQKPGIDAQVLADAVNQAVTQAVDTALRSENFALAISDSFHELPVNYQNIEQAMEHAYDKHCERNHDDEAEGPDMGFGRTEQVPFEDLPPPLQVMVRNMSAMLGMSMPTILRHSDDQDTDDQTPDTTQDDSAIDANPLVAKMMRVASEYAKRRNNGGSPQGFTG